MASNPEEEFRNQISRWVRGLPVYPRDRQQQGTTDRESEHSTQDAAAQQPVVHDDQPSDADHGAPSQGEIVSGAQFAGESGHGTGLWGARII